MKDIHLIFKFKYNSIIQWYLKIHFEHINFPRISADSKEYFLRTFVIDFFCICQNIFSRIFLLFKDLWWFFLNIFWGPFHFFVRVFDIFSRKLTFHNLSRIVRNFLWGHYFFMDFKECFKDCNCSKNPWKNLKN